MKTKAYRYIFMYCLLLIALLVAALEFERNPNARPIQESIWSLNILHYAKLVAELSARTQRQLDREIVSDTLRGIESPTLLPSTKRFDRHMNITISHPKKDVRVHYSLDGSIPTPRHPIAEGTISITESTVIRAKAFDSGGDFSATVTGSYILSPPKNTTVASLVLDPVFLYDKHVGIYINPLQKGRAWERPALLTILPPKDSEILETELSVRVHGGVSRSFQKKSLRLYVSSQDIDFRPLFGTNANSISATQTEWVLRHAGSNHQLYRDRLGRRIAHQMGLIAGTDVPCLLYVNGELWGVYDLMERINEAFLIGKIGDGSFIIHQGGLYAPALLSSPTPLDKSNEWNDFYELLATANVKDPHTYAQLKKLVNLDEFIDYMILGIFSTDPDRPQWNMNLFRENKPNSLWRFLVWDLDGGFNNRGLYTKHDTLAWSLRDQPLQHLKLTGSPDNQHKVKSTLIFRRLLENNQFQASFRNRFQVLLDTVLSSKQLHATFDQVLSDFSDTLHIEKRRFSAPLSSSSSNNSTSYKEQIMQIRQFLTRRPAIVQQMLNQHIPLN